MPPKAAKTGASGAKENQAGDKRKNTVSETKEEQAQGSGEDSSEEPPRKRQTTLDNSSSKDDGGAVAKRDNAEQEKLESKEDGREGSEQPLVKDEEKELEGKSGEWRIVERGIIHFLYRPKVQSVKESKEEGPAAESLDDVQRTHVILLPRTSDDTHDTDVGFRMLTIGKKRMPNPEAALEAGQEPGGIGGRTSEAIWATVAEVGADSSEVTSGLEEKTNETKTRGLRVHGAARPAGRGYYLLSVRETNPPSSRQVRLSYHLSHPSSDEFGDVQRALGLENPAASVLIQMRNPTLPQTGPGAPPAGLPEERRAELTDEQMRETFGGEYKAGKAQPDDKAEGSGNRYGRPERMDLLDQAGVELLLTAKSKDRKDQDQVAAGEHEQKALEHIAQEDAEELSDEDVLKELAMSAKDFPVDALSGNWV